jgi:hypothetical protein
MDRFCDKCSIKLAKKSETNFGCPSCHSQFELSNDKLTRTAQFGGNMAKPTMQGPGSSPLFNGTSNKNRGTNTRFETSFDSIMSRSHRPAPLDPERNVEKRLEQFHVHAEEDSIPYELDKKERARLKIRKEIRRREKFYEDAAQRMETNSVQFIKDHFKPTQEQTQTLEESLSSRRKYEKKKEKSIAEDVSHDQIQPERRHSVAFSKSKLTTVFDNIESDTDAEQDYNPKFLTVGPFEGVYGGTLKSNLQLDQYLDEESFDIGRYLNDTVNLDFPDVDEGHSSIDFNIDHPSLVIFDFDPNDDSIEEGLEKLMDIEHSDGLPQIKSPQDINRDKQTKNPRSVFDAYPIAPIGTTPLPK